jgi:hypothetical protein
MRKRYIRAGLPVLLAVVLAFTGCENPSNSGDSGSLELRGTVNITGNFTVGETLTADTAALEGDGPILYQWIQGESTPIERATAASYVPVVGDANRTIKVQVRRIGYSGTIESEPTEPIGRGGFNYALSNTVKYFSFAQGKELDASKSNTAEWDIAIAVKKDGFCYILTNSGVTATDLGTGGQGGVWFTNKTDFDSVVLADRVTDFSGENAEYANYVTDVTRYQTGMFNATSGTMNIMTYYGYLSGDGLTEATAFGWSKPGPPSAPFYEFNKKAFAYVEGGMPPPWFPTNQVYIIQHGDGTSYSKFQVNTLRYRSGYTFILSFRFKNLTE